MKESPAGSLQARSHESGYILLYMLVMVLLVSISLAVAAPKLATEMQRDKELEYYHRGQQYARAIRLYYTRMGHFPTDISQLEKTNDIRFLRKRYRDPMTGALDWHLIHQGEAKSQLTGLFGQTYSSEISGGTAPGAPIGLVAANPAAINGGVNTSSYGSNTFGSSSSFASSASFGSGNSPGGSGLGGGGSNSGAFSLSASSSTSSSTSSNSAPANGDPSTSDSIGGTFSSHPGMTEQPAFGAGIVGVSSTSKKVSIRVYKKQTEYDRWEFVYNPAEDGITGGMLPGMNTPGVIAPPVSGGTGGVNVDPSLQLPPAPGQTPPPPPPAPEHQ